MKAILCKEYGPPESLVLEEVASPKAGKGQVVVTVKAAGVNFPDTLVIQGKYQFKPDMPFTPGGELAGTIKEVGEGVTEYKPGDNVIVFTGTTGGFAQEAVVDVPRITPMPDGVDFPAAAGFIMTYGTSYHALKDRAQIKPGETLLVLGAAGGVGLSAVELGKIMGARVIAAASSDEKLEICKQYGADEVINYSTEDLKERIKALTNGKGADVVYDPLGDKYSEVALRNTAWNGRFLVIGFAAGEIPKIPLNLTLLKGCSIVGVFWGSFTQREPEKYQAGLKEMLGWLQAGKLKPHVSATYPLERAPDALNDMLNRRVKGKAIILPNG